MTLFRHVKTKYGAVPVHDIIKMRDQASPTYIKFELHRNVSSHTIPTGRYRSKAIHAFPPQIGITVVIENN
jgi:uncharacterized protein with HEPN domain